MCYIALCGIHLGSLRYLSSRTLFGPYLQVCGFFYYVALEDLTNFIFILF